MSIIGLDLAGVETRPTGYCKLLDMKVATSLIYPDQEILQKSGKYAPDLLPLLLP